MARKVNIKRVIKKSNPVPSGTRIVDVQPPAISSTMSYDIQTATGGQTVFTTSFIINRVFKNNTLVNPEGVYTGHGTMEITFLSGLLAGDEIYMST